MGRYKILYYPLAKQDLEEIYLYIAEQMPRTALGVIDKITSIIERLGDYPYRYKLYHPRKREVLDIEFRIMPISQMHYNVYYVVDEEEKVVKISRILYSNQEPGRHLSFNQGDSDE